MSLKKYNILLVSGIWSTKDPKFAQIMALVRVSDKLIDEKNIYQKVTTGIPDIHQGRSIIYQGPPILNVGKIQIGLGTRTIQNIISSVPTPFQATE